MGFAKCSTHPTRNQFITIVLIRFGTSPTAIVSITFIVGASITDAQPDPRIGDEHPLAVGRERDPVGKRRDRRAAQQFHRGLGEIMAKKTLLYRHDSASKPARRSKSCTVRVRRRQFFGTAGVRPR
jgi:hypothetical protein